MKAPSNKLKKGMIFLTIVIIVSMILSIPAVAMKVGELTGWAGDKIIGAARTITSVGIGALILVAAIAFSAVPILGVTLLIVGFTILAYSVWPLFKKDLGKG